LSRIAEQHQSILDAGYKLRRLRREARRIPSPACHDVPAPSAHRSAPIGDQVPCFPPPSRNAFFEDRGVRTTRDIAPILRVPVGQQHDQDFESVELASSDEGVIVPRPAVFLEQLVDSGIVEFETRLPELSSLVDARPCALQIATAGDRSFVHEVRRLGEVSTRPGHTNCEVLRADLVAPFDAPSPAC